MQIVEVKKKVVMSVTEILVCINQKCSLTFKLLNIYSKKQKKKDEELDKSQVPHLKQRINNKRVLFYTY